MVPIEPLVALMQAYFGHRNIHNTTDTRRSHRIGSKVSGKIDPFSAPADRLFAHEHRLLRPWVLTTTVTVVRRHLAVTLVCRLVHPARLNLMAGDELVSSGSTHPAA